MTEYTIEQGLGVRERMNLLAAVNGPATLALFDALDVPVGARCLDLGCGAGQVTMELARRTAPTGSAVGIDLDEAMIEIQSCREIDLFARCVGRPAGKRGRR